MAIGHALPDRQLERRRKHAGCSRCFRRSNVIVCHGTDICGSFYPDCDRACAFTRRGRFGTRAGRFGVPAVPPLKGPGPAWRAGPRRGRSGARAERSGASAVPAVGSSPAWRAGLSPSQSGLRTHADSRCLRLSAGLWGSALPGSGLEFLSGSQTARLALTGCGLSIAMNKPSVLPWQSPARTYCSSRGSAQFVLLANPSDPGRATARRYLQ